MNILEKARKIMEQPVCDNCLGRQFGQLLSGTDNEQRGAILRKIVAMSIDREKLSEEDKKIDISNFYGIDFHYLTESEVKRLSEGQSIHSNRHNPNIKDKLPEKKTCSVCNQIFERIDNIVNNIGKLSKGIEFRTFLIGTKVSSQLLANEENLWESVGIDWAEQIKAELNREIGRRVESKLKKKFDPKNPEVVFLVDVSMEKISVSINPLFIYGEYQKLARGIPQTKWPSGKYKTSVEQIIAKSFMKLTQGSAHAFHGCVSGQTSIFLNECEIKIEELEKEWENHRVVVYDEVEGKIKTSGISDFMKLEQQTYLLRTIETGREIICSGEHPFFTPDGMKPLLDIKFGDKVAVNPEIPEKFEIDERKVIFSEKDLQNTSYKYFKNSNQATSFAKIRRELKEAGLLPLFNTNPKISILIRLVAFLFGDGHVKLLKKRDIGLEFYGEKNDLIRIQSDIKHLGFNASLHNVRGRVSRVTDYYGKEKSINGSDQSKLTCYSKSLCTLLIGLGAPIGDKVVNNLEMPSWTENIERHLKKEFLSTLLGCEIDTPRTDNRKYNKKSFNSPRFSMNKIESKIENGTKFMESIARMLNEFGVRTYKLRLLPYTTRKDGNKSMKMILDFKNDFHNLINLYGNVGLRYCQRKEKAARLCLEHLRYKKHTVEKRRELFNKALDLKKQGYQLAEIHKKLDSNLVSKKDLWLWIHEKINPNNIKIPNDFPNFDEWVKSASEKLNDGIIWETVDFIEEKGNDIVYDITVPTCHNFFANGFLVSNCGREDIDAKCLAWRPYVLEIKEPKLRNIDLKKTEKIVNKDKRVKVRGLRLSTMNEVRIIKAMKADKSYRAIVKCKNEINPDLLKNFQSLQTEIRQRTPERVIHRRADLKRKRIVKEIKVKLINSKTLELFVTTEAGLYIKELISGDNGRTQPNLSELLQNECVCKELDVVKIHLPKNK